jgi:hypothetical protein
LKHTIQQDLEYNLGSDYGRRLATYRIDDKITKLSTQIKSEEESSTQPTTYPPLDAEPSGFPTTEEDTKLSPDSKMIVNRQSRTESPFSGVTMRSTWKVLNSSLGVLSFRTTLTKTRTSREIDEERAEADDWHKTITIIVAFRFGSCRRGFRIKAMNNIFGFNNLTALRNVPDDSAIFEACKIGNIQRMKQLIAFNMASPHDVDSSGMSPLHVSRFSKVLISQLME